MKDHIGVITPDVVCQRSILQVLAAIAIRLDQHARILLVRPMAHGNERRRQAFPGEVSRLIGNEFYMVPAGQLLPDKLDHMREHFAGPRPGDVQTIAIGTTQMQQQQRILASRQRQYRPRCRCHCSVDDLPCFLELAHFTLSTAIQRDTPVIDTFTPLPSRRHCRHGL